MKTFAPRLSAVAAGVLVAVALPFAGVAHADTSAVFNCNGTMYTSTPGSTISLTSDCSMTGTVPATATVVLGNGDGVTAASGSGNAGTIKFENGLNNSIVTAGGGVFTNTGTIVSLSPDHREVLYAGHFVNSGTIESTTLSGGFVFDDESGASHSGGMLENEAGGTIETDAGAGMSIQNVITLKLDPNSSVVAGAGGNLQVSQTAIDEAGGTISGTVNLFNGSITYESGAATSTGSLAMTSDCSLIGTIPKGWSVTLSAAGLAAADGSGNAGTVTFKDGLNSSITTSAGATFTNTGSIIDTSPDHRQVLYAGHFVNTGTIESTMPDNGVIFDDESGKNAGGLLENESGGMLKTDPNAYTSIQNAITVKLDPGSTVVAGAGSNFQVAQTTLDAAGGNLSGTINAFASGLDFEAAAATSSGSIASTSNGGLTGTIPAGWSVSVTGGGLAGTAGAGNAGTLSFLDGNPGFTATGSFTNSGTIVDSFNGGTGFTAAPLVNTGTISVPGTGNLGITGGLSLAPSSVLSVGVASAGSYGNVSVSGSASLAGAIAAVRSPSYNPAVGDKQTVLTAGSLSGTFSSLRGGNGAGFYSVAYTPTTATLVTSTPPPAGPAAETGLLHLSAPKTLLAKTVTGTTKVTVAGKAGVPGKGASAAVVLVTASTPVTVGGVKVSGSALLTIPVKTLTLVAKSRSAVRITVVGYYGSSAGTSGDQFHKVVVTLKTAKAFKAFREGHGAVAVLVKVTTPVSAKLGGITVPAGRGGQYLLVELSHGAISGTLPTKANVSVIGYLAPLSASTSGAHRQPSGTRAGSLTTELH